MITVKVKELFGKEETKATNAEIEEELEKDEVVGIYIPFYIQDLKQQYTDLTTAARGLNLPVNQVSSEQFTSIEEMIDHIKNKNGNKKSFYYFDRNDEEVRNAVMDAFRELECEKLKAEKQEAEQTLEETQEKLEQLENCEDDNND